MFWRSGYGEMPSYNSHHRSIELWLPTESDSGSKLNNVVEL